MVTIKPTILGVNASPFHDGNVAIMLAAALQAAQESGAQVETIHLGDIPHHDGRRDEGRSQRQRLAALPRKGNLQKIVREIRGVDGVIFATPTHGYNPGTRLMALMGWLFTVLDAPEYSLKGKVAAAMAVCEEDGGEAVVARIAANACHMGMVIPPFGVYYFNKHSAEKSEGGWASTDQALAGRNVARMIKVLHGQLTPEDWNDHTNSW